MLKDRRRGNSETRASCSETSVAWTGAFLILCTFFLCTLCSVSRIFILNFMRNYKEKSVANNECAWSDPVETKCRDITLTAFCDWWSDCSYLGFIWKLILCEAPSRHVGTYPWMAKRTQVVKCTSALFVVLASSLVSPFLRPSCLDGTV